MIKLEDYYKVFVGQLANKNQFVVWFKNDANNQCVAFQSYQTLIAILDGHTLYINWQKWDYSKTTLKHLKMFVNEYTPYTYETKYQFLCEIRSNQNIIPFEE